MPPIEKTRGHNKKGRPIKNLKVIWRFGIDKFMIRPNKEATDGW